MYEEEIKECIMAKRTPISSCVGLSKYFIGRHRTLPVYLTPQFEREFNSKMAKAEELKRENQQLKENNLAMQEEMARTWAKFDKKEDIINKITNYCKFQIEKEKDKFPKPLESKEWLKGRISAFEEILDNKG